MPAKVVNVTAIRAAKVQRVVAEIMFRKYGETEDYPVVEDFDWTSGPPCWAIVSEEGPYDWAMEIAFDVQEAVDELGLFVEPITGWALGIYPA